MVYGNPIHGGRTLRIAGGIIVLVLVFAGGAGATKIIKDNATGGDCTSFGTWNAVKKICTMTLDLNETIQIDSNGLTLDGNGHTVKGNTDAIYYTLSGVILSGRSSILVKNINIRRFQTGVNLANSNNNHLIGINTSLNEDGIYLGASNNNTLSGNNASNNDGEGIKLYYSSITIPK